MITKKTYLNFALKYALILLALRILIDVIVKQMQLGYVGESSAGILALFIEAFVIVFAIRGFKKNISGGFLAFTDAIKVGLIIAVLLGIGYSLYSYVYNHYIDPEYQFTLLHEVATKMGQDPEEIIDAQKQQQQKMPWISYLEIPFGVLKYIFIGAITSLVAGAVLKKDDIVA